MTIQVFKDLLFSLAWNDCSAYHAQNVKNILKKECPDIDFTEELKLFYENKLMHNKKGCPRIL